MSVWILNLRLLLQAPLPPAFLARTFQVRLTYLGSASLLFHDSLVVMMAPLGALAVGLPGVAARAVPARSRAARSASTRVIVSARSERPCALLLVVLMMPSSLTGFGAAAVAAQPSGRTLFDPYHAPRR